MAENNKIFSGFIGADVANSIAERYAGRILRHLALANPEGGERDLDESDVDATFRKFDQDGDPTTATKDEIRAFLKAAGLDSIARDTVVAIGFRKKVKKLFGLTPGNKIRLDEIKAEWRKYPEFQLFGVNIRPPKTR